MASISESLIQGLLQPSLNFQNLQEPLGMLMGGARAQRAKEERQMQAIQSLSSAQTPEQVSAALSSMRNPKDAATAVQLANLLAQLGQTQAETSQVANEAATREQTIRALSDPNSDLSKRLGTSRETVLSAYSLGSPTAGATALKDALQSRVPVNPELVSQLQGLSASGNPAAASYIRALQDTNGYVDRATQEAALRYLGTYSNKGSDKAVSPELVSLVKGLNTPLGNALADELEKNPSPTTVNLAVDAINNADYVEALNEVDTNSISAIEAAIPNFVNNPQAMRYLEDRLASLKEKGQIDFDRVEKVLGTGLGTDNLNWSRNAIQLAKTFETLLKDKKYVAGKQYALDTAYVTAFSSDVKALGEFDRLGISNDLIGRISDGLSKLTTGTLTQESLNDLRMNLRRVSVLSTRKILEIADRIEDREPDTARDIRKMFQPSIKDL
jgi:hypothetical protein